MAERRLIAKEDIPLGGVLAVARGQAVPEQVVTDNGWQASFVGEGTKEAQEIWADITGRPADSFSSSTATTSRKSTSSQEG